MEKNEEWPIVEQIKLLYAWSSILRVQFSSVRLCSSTKLLIETGEIVKKRKANTILH